MTARCTRSRLARTHSRVSRCCRSFCCGRVVRDERRGGDHRAFDLFARARHGVVDAVGTRIRRRAAGNAVATTQPKREMMSTIVDEKAPPAAMPDPVEAFKRLLVTTGP